MRTLWKSAAMLSGWLLASAPLCAQGSGVPVVLLNGYQASCGATSGSTGTFGSMQSLLTADGWQVSFFDNCSVSPGTTGENRPNIEQLGQAFGNFLQRLGAPEVDVVAHSMGGLIVRAYLSGKLSQGGFAPPASVRIRKAIFIATPQAGLLAISGLLGGNSFDSQLVEMFAGSNFLWDLATWNQRMDDLRGVDALTLAGNLGSTSNVQHADDGVVTLTSASLAVTLGDSRVRVLPYCHADNLPSFLCSGPGIAFVHDRAHPAYQIVKSFLLDTEDWKTIGTTASQDPVLSRYGGLLLDVRDNIGNSIADPGSAAVIGAPEQGNLPRNSAGVFFADSVAAGQYQVRVDGGTYPLPVAAGGHVALEVKPGPQIAFVAPAAGNVSTLDRAPGMLVSIYGSSLQGSSVTIDGTASPVFFNSSTQINTIVPSQSQGLVEVSVANATGQDNLNIFVAPAVPAIFSLDGSGTGAALALHGDASIVSSSSPAQAGETISIFLTGLGVPAETPVLTVNGATVNVTGLTTVGDAPGVLRVDFVVPGSLDGSSPATLQASAGLFSSNMVTLPAAPLQSN